MKRLLAILMSVLMVCALAMPVSAEDEYSDWSSGTSTPKSGAWKLTEDITVNDQLTINGDMTIDLNGHTLTLTLSGLGALTNNSAYILTIEDNSVEQTGKVKGSGSSGYLIYINNAKSKFVLKGGEIINDNGNNAVYINSGSSFEMTGGKITNNGGSSSNALYVNSNGTTAIINDGEITDNSGSAAIYANAGANVTVNDCVITNNTNNSNPLFVNGNSVFTFNGGKIVQNSTYTSKAAVYANNGSGTPTVNINGGTITSSTIGVYAPNANVTITGGTIDTDGHTLQTRYATIEPAEGKEVNIISDKSLFYAFSDSDNKVSGGNFDTANILTSYGGGTNNDPEISGGSFASDPTEYLSEDVAAAKVEKNDGSGTSYVVGEEDIQEAAQNAQEGDKITITDGSVTLTDVPIGVKVAVDETNTGSTTTVNGTEVAPGVTVTVEPTPTPTPIPDLDPEKPSRPTYRPSSPSKDLPSNTKECQKEFGDEYIWSDEYDACVIKFMIVDTSTK